MPKTPRERDAWMEAVLADPKLDSGAKCLALRIGFHLNLKTRQCNPGYQRLADGTGMKLAAIPKQLNRIIARGFLTRESSRGRHTNNYILSLPEQSAITDDDRLLGRSETADAHTRLMKHQTADADTGFEMTNPIRGSDSTAYGHQIEPPTRVGANTEPSENTEKNSEKRKDSPSLPLQFSNDARTVAKQRDFQEFWDTYPRKVGKKGAERAFEKSIRRREATAEQIIAGAARLAAAWHGQADLTFCPHPSTWLNDGRWTDEVARGPRQGACRQTDEMRDSVETLQRWAER